MARTASAPCLSQNRNANLGPAFAIDASVAAESSSVWSAAATGSGSIPGFSVAMMTSTGASSLGTSIGFPNARLHSTSTFVAVASSSKATRKVTDREPSSVGAGLNSLSSYTRAVKSWRSVYRLRRSIDAASVQVRPSMASRWERAGRPSVMICASVEGRGAR